MNRSTFHTIGAVAAVAVMLSSCAKNEVISSRRPALDPDAIAFSVSSGFVPVDMPESKSGGQAEEKPAVLLGDNGDTLYLHPSVVPNERGFSAAPETRGVPIEDPSGIDSIFVTAKINDGGSEAADALYIDAEKVTRIGEGGTIWTTSEGQHFWPDESTTLDFYAYANIGFDNNSPAYAKNLVCENGKLGFSYISSGSAGSDAVRQPDILFALASASRSQTTDGDGTVDLNFQHALAGIQFRAKNIAGGTIKSITIKNVCGQGYCEYTLSDETTDSGARMNGTFEWSKLSDKKDFTQTMLVKVNESSTLPDGTLQDVTTEANNKMTFMMIPQSTEGVEVEIELEGDLDKKTYTVSGKLSGPDPSSPITWEAGNIYIYDISTDSINWTYVFEVTPTINMVLGQTSAPYTVTSYRFRTQLGDSEANREPVPWTAINTNFSESNFHTGDKENITYNDVVTSFVYSGGASTDSFSKKYNLEVVGTKMHTTWDYDEKTLRGESSKGTPDNPYNLATDDGGDGNETTANCYVVNAAGYYKLPLVYGNALKNGTDNTSAYSGGNFKDYKNKTINDPYINNADDATLVWSDGFYMFKDIKLDADKKYLTFHIDPNYLQQANAVLAVRDANDDIMWSWHIWVTERDINKTHSVIDWFDSSNTFELMSSNLGWVDGKNVYYNQRDIAYEFTQKGSGKKAEMVVKQEGREFDYKDVGSTYYQWGRKDPLVAMRNWDAVGADDYRLHETGRSDYGYDTQTGGITLGDAIQHPNIYYTRAKTEGGENWCKDNITVLWNNYDSGGQDESTFS
ncbi:MAG TPA: fimbrillin family protein, partial [Candidatus Cryptobacteroides merdipullorum]|nr:fimbrillin family protein [Candidatus Cryptobacteroides merdipullorum]